MRQDNNFDCQIDWRQQKAKTAGFTVIDKISDFPQLELVFGYTESRVLNYTQLDSAQRARSLGPQNLIVVEIHGFEI
jgi:hypothetical protein